ncbi:MAG: hypothetical protein K0R31_1433 [Clostridiales bacterium]|nr:hypothetical protein [Clostridiales bacterium]
MILIKGSPIEKSVLTESFPGSGIENKIIEMMNSSQTNFDYPSHDHLRFELDLRKSIIKAAVDLAHSRFRFEIFRESECNPIYWDRSEEGGFQLKSGLKPSDAIRDIYINSREYGTECATAIVIVFLKALVDLLPEELFNQLFSDLYLMNWQHLNSDLRVLTEKDLTDYFPGDCRYFKNPDVDPLTPEWQGENVIDLGDALYYGHGVGIRNGDQIIDILNRKRKSDSQEPAYLLNTATRPGFKYLAERLTQYNSQILAPSRSSGCHCLSCNHKC